MRSFIYFSIVLLVLILFMLFRTNTKNMTNKYNTKKKAICFLSASFSDKLYKFVKELAKDDTDQEYDFYICIDKGDERDNKNKDDITDITDITLLFVNGKRAEDNGFHSSVLYFQGRACSRDKALYYFSIEKKDYDKVWMIEDDVFFYNLETIRRLDRRYPDADLLTKQFDIIRNEREKNEMRWDNWHFLTDKIGFPWTKGMICAIRVSSSLLSAIRDYALKNKTLLFDESMFTTLSLHSNLIIETPPEFQEVDYYDHINWNYLNQTHFLHPVKDPSFHEQLRQRLKK